MLGWRKPIDDSGFNHGIKNILGNPTLSLREAKKKNEIIIIIIINLLTKKFFIKMYLK